MANSLINIFYFILDSLIIIKINVVVVIWQVACARKVIYNIYIHVS